MKRAYALIIIPVAALALGACGGGGNNSGHSTNGLSTNDHSMAATGTASAEAGHNAQDVRFAQMMIPHHRQAITMAGQATAKASSPEVRKLAARIEQAQEPEIEKMTGWLRDWGAPAAAPGGVHMHMPEGMMSEHAMRRLGTLSGTSFDRTFLHMMIRHHQGAVAMARTEQARGSNGDAKALAASIANSQSAEIAKMRHLLQSL